MTRARAIALAGLILLPSCRDTSSPEPAIGSHRVVDAGPLVKRVDVVLLEPGAVRVTYGPPEERLEVESEGPSTSHSLVLTRLLPGVTYEYEVRAASDIATGAFGTDDLPADLAAVTFRATGDPTEPLTLLEFFRLQGSAAYAGVAIVDRAGRVVWYFPATRAITGSTRRANGNFVFLDVTRGLLEVTSSGDVVAVLAQDDDRTLHHEVIAVPGDVLYALRLDRKTVLDTVVAGEAIWEWNPATGTEVRRWSSFDVLDPVADRGSTYSPGDWLHANSLSVGPRGNVVVSLHHLDQIISIAPGFGALEWRLAGTNATIPLSLSDRSPASTRRQRSRPAACSCSTTASSAANRTRAASNWS